MAKSETPKKKMCFVVGPIGKEGSDVRTHSDWLFDGIIKPAFDGFAEFEKPVRADMIAQPGMITTQVIEHLLDDDLVVADLSLANPNAFYEIGIRHMVQRPIVHMQLKGEVEPFDTSGFRAIKFALRHPSDLVEARRDLAAAVKLATTDDYRVENPVTHARGAIQLEQSATPEQKVVLEEMRSIAERVSVLETEKSARPYRQRPARIETIFRVQHMAYESAELAKLVKDIGIMFRALDVDVPWTYREVMSRGTPMLEIVVNQPLKSVDTSQLRDVLLGVENVTEVRVIAGMINEPET